MADEVKRTFDLTDADYERSIGIMVLHQKASASFLQRTMSLGYNAAASLMERAEKDGFVSRAANSGKRNVLIGLPEIAKLRADLANAGAVMVEAALRLPAYDSDGDPAGQFDHHVFVRRDELRALSTLSPIAAAAGVLLADPDTFDGFKGYILNRHDMDTTMSDYAEGAMDYLRALAEQEKADE